MFRWTLIVLACITAYTSYRLWGPDVPVIVRERAGVSGYADYKPDWFELEYIGPGNLHDVRILVFVGDGAPMCFHIHCWRSGQREQFPRVFHDLPIHLEIHARGRVTHLDLEPMSASRMRLPRR